MSRFPGPDGPWMCVTPDFASSVDEVGVAEAEKLASRGQGVQ